MALQRNSLATGALAGAKYTLSSNGGSPKLALPRHNDGIFEGRKEYKKCWMIFFGCRAQVVYERSNWWWLWLSRWLMAAYQADTGVCRSLCCYCLCDRHQQTVCGCEQTQTGWPLSSKRSSTEIPRGRFTSEVKMLEGAKLISLYSRSL
jgi:hypothetical protein